jgi:hypothetical protein
MCDTCADNPAYALTPPCRCLSLCTWLPVWYLSSLCTLQAPSRRPDRVAESQTIQKGQAMNQRSAWGNVPGIKVNHR